ncbi:hypothetical protein [Acetobacter orleanensis]|uniref:Tail fiber protein n=1 Tax=Acetobacter orleanensis TaxID=104099 RepID=A0A4Y3TL42_9PROT|nr:hypothetical protein [Acetobacter orleanensis]PCD79712.1 phage tail protein [Acetobacter orleanensis]GAN69275.1 tail fiber protein [Acetobacter orleanensis JCM 7639]GBR28263.1 hypothetical protein AA0473_1690 [Acetobacter orleanensis NRIC 0473]GEB82199.1 hypothetical protein AOR01nite_06760 [Acetobacter orleanensis]
MKQSDFPQRFAVPIAQNAAASDVSAIPATQASTGDGTVSLALGFPPETFIARSAGGVPPRGQDMNGLLNLISKILQAYQAGCWGMFDAGFAQAIGGYPAGAVVAGSTPGTFWVSTADDNVSPPGAAGARWQNLFSGYLPLSGGTVSWLNVSGQLVQEGFGGIIAQASPTNPQTGDFINYPTFGSIAEGRGGKFYVGLQEKVGTTFSALMSLQFSDGSWRFVGWGQNTRIHDSQFGDVAYTSDLQGVAHASDLKNYVASSTYNNDFGTEDSRVINLAYGHRIQAFTVPNVQNSAGGTNYVTFPVAFSGIPVAVLANTSQDGDMDVWTYNWSSTQFAINIPSTSGDHNKTVSIIAIGPK